MSKVRIQYCPCDNKQQDKDYGPHQRVHNECNEGAWRCAACGTKKEREWNAAR